MSRVRCEVCGIVLGLRRSSAYLRCIFCDVRTNVGYDKNDYEVRID